LLDRDPNWQPESYQQRKAILSEEAQYVTYYTQTDLPGYAKINIDEETGSMLMDYFPAFGAKPFDTVDLSALLSRPARDKSIH
jgi:hypothetical protein